jgi:hypothetical protein
MARSILTMAALATSTMTVTMGSMTALATVSPVMPASADTVAEAMAAVEAMAVAVEATANQGPSMSGIALVDRIGPANLSSVGSMRASRYPQQVRSGR